jgi:hypothetical protein
VSNEAEFLTMKEIGKVFGTSSHVIGRKLKELGLRNSEGRPTQAAFQGNYCDRRWTSDGLNYCWAWQRDKTIELLLENGLGRADEEPASTSEQLQPPVIPSHPL